MLDVMGVVATIWAIGIVVMWMSEGPTGLGKGV